MEVAFSSAEDQLLKFKASLNDEELALWEEHGTIDSEEIALMTGAVIEEPVKKTIKKGVKKK
jgi:hypothetical protein